MLQLDSSFSDNLQTYGIPTISHLLTKTGQFSKPETSFKRYTDTAALIGEMVENSPTSQRAFISVARTRFLHSGYQASGKILDADLLYTLALFAVQPVRFIENFEWRTLSDLELCAIGTFWKSLGDALGISSEILPSGKTGFKDGMQWLEEVDVWSQDYEAKYMVPDPKNRESADQATAVLLYNLPKFLHPIGLQFTSYMMDDRLRKAMLYVILVHSRSHHLILYITTDTNVKQIRAPNSWLERCFLIPLGYSQVRSALSIATTACGSCSVKHISKARRR